MDLFTSYSPPAQLYDELYNPQGNPHSQWQYLLPALNSLGEQGLAQRQIETRRLLRDNGVVHNAYGDSSSSISERQWQLDPIPLALSSEEWRGIERGIQQRAELLRLLLADLYGPRETLQKNLLPVPLIYGHPGYLLPCIDVAPSTHHLPLYAADLARAADGSFYVVSDRSQAPSGAGYALENRMVLSRILPSLFRDAQVHRLAHYFRTLRNTMAQLAWQERDDIRIVMLTPGPNSVTYFEHAYLSRYLGYTLVQGDDLAVRDTQVCLKTLDGLQPVDVILRYTDDLLCDPLELAPDSGIGIAGLLQAVRLKQVAIANPLGSGILENPALMAFLPALAQHFLGEDLLLPSPETFWCGQDSARQYVLANLPDLLIHKITHGRAKQQLDGRCLTAQQHGKLSQQINKQPHLYVGQEAVISSTTPIFDDNKLQARSMLLRTFLVASSDDYVVFPGGLCRVAAQPDGTIDSVQTGGTSKDTWIIASEPIQPLTLVDKTELSTAFILHQGELPSRVAENLFWLGRYAERSENITRLLRTVFLYLLGTDDRPVNNIDDYCLRRLLQAVTRLTETYPGFVGKGAEQRLQQPDEELLSILLDTKRVGSLSSSLNGLLYAVRAVRDRISPDIWRVFNDIDEGLQLLQRSRKQLSFTQEANETLLNRLITAFAAFTGLAMDSMTHGQGWRFMMLGRRLERAQQTLQLLSATLANQDNYHVQKQTVIVEYLLRTCDSLMTYRSRYRSQFQIKAALELLLQDESNPRSVGYQLRHLQHDSLKLPGITQALPYRERSQRLILELFSQIRLADIDQLCREPAHKLESFLNALSDLLPELSNALSDTYFTHAEPAKQLVNYVRDD